MNRHTHVHIYRYTPLHIGIDFKLIPRLLYLVPVYIGLVYLPSLYATDCPCSVHWTTFAQGFIKQQLSQIMGADSKAEKHNQNLLVEEHVM